MHAIYHGEDELGLGKKGGGDTALCPFDCQLWSAECCRQVAAAAAPAAAAPAAAAAAAAAAMAAATAATAVQAAGGSARTGGVCGPQRVHIISCGQCVTWDEGPHDWRPHHGSGTAGSKGA
uniref:Uncharacterized protein n=1 Tax=Tetradesmus obliquus TaxID=3088 RepID=A0A383VC04_TETOB|eukprot:jgi/Sobl393_1/17725/SZX63107.1